MEVSDDMDLHNFLSDGNRSPVGGKWERLRGDKKVHT